MYAFSCIFCGYIIFIYYIYHCIKLSKIDLNVFIKWLISFSQALLLAEDKVDAQAATQARVEQAADLAEFNESVPLDADVC